jgi:hypothetical protein
MTFIHVVWYINITVFTLAYKLSYVHIMAACSDERRCMAYNGHKLMTLVLLCMVVVGNGYCDSLHSTRNFAIWYVSLLLLVVYACVHILSCIPVESRRYNSPDLFHFAYLNMLVSMFLFGVLVSVYVHGVQCYNDMSGGLVYIGCVFTAVHATVSAWCVKFNWIHALREIEYMNLRIDLATSTSSDTGCLDEVTAEASAHGLGTDDVVELSAEESADGLGTDDVVELSTEGSVDGLGTDDVVELSAEGSVDGLGTDDVVELSTEGSVDGLGTDDIVEHSTIFTIISVSESDV